MSLTNLPRAGIDRIDGAGAALKMFDLLIARPLRDQTLALLLDREHRGISVLIVEGTCLPDSVLDVARLLADTATGHPRLAAVVLASVRPGPVVTGSDSDSDTDSDDVDRWADLDDQLAEAGVELVEWFVLGPGRTASCPRDLLGAPPRW
ncbi:MAG TPA: hypothetical protein VNQ73_04435 [Ilumatobacter sp.]|nr:hypothetical protein [Ilumatobacter sp.]